MAQPATAAVRLLTGEREPVRLATTGNIDVDTGGLLTIDGVVTEVGDRVLVKDQTDGSENGIRTASEGQWYRAADARTARTMQKGMTVRVQEGATNADKVFLFNTDDPQVGDDDIDIIPDTVAGIVPGATGLVLLGKELVSDVRNYLDTAPYVATRTALKALDTTKDIVALLTEPNRAGIFVWRAGDLSTLVALDPGEALWIKADAIATTAGAWVRQVDGPYNPLWFGCTIDGVASDTAFGRFIDVLVATSNPGQLPTGTITLASKITKNIGQSPLRLYGSGTDVSILRWTAADGGFDITSTRVTGFVQWSRQIDIRDFSLKTNQASGGTAFKHTLTPASISNCTSVANFANLSFIGEDTNADYWTKGIHIVDGWNTTIERCDFKGVDDDGQTPFLQTHGVYLTRCNDCHVLSSHFYHMINGIVSDSDTPSYGDGVAVIDCRIVGVDNGIILTTTTTASAMAIFGNHVNAYVQGIYMNGFAYTEVRDNQIFKTNPSVITPWYGIEAIGGFFNVFSGNDIAMPGTAGVTTNFGIHLSGGNGHIVTSNKFHDTTSTFYGVYLTAGAAGCTVIGNRADSTVDAVVGTSGTVGTGHHIRNNYPVTVVLTFTSGDTTPSVGADLTGVIKTANAGATSITTFDDGYDGQEFELLVTDDNTTLVNGATLSLLGAQNTLVPNGGVLRFRKIGSVWYETYRSYAVGNLIVGSYTKPPQSPVHAYAAANSFQIVERIENDNVGAGVAALGFSVTGSGAETRSAKAGLGFTRNASNGRGLLDVFLRTSNDTSDFDATDIKSGWNGTGIFHNFKGADAASAATVVPTGNLFHVTGTTGITSISGTNIRAGTTIRMIFDGILTVTAGSNLKMAGNFTTSASDMLVMTWDGTNWYEEGRSANA
ncbi:right-handed parallel beta-helix repeat-containing protein [Mesorhizobium amorphae]|uniref:Periplasmic copper-binding protein NosD beta helix domain-containing protein n=1 Tax=Mesorhizobium amorphae CCNWGS0123 TaxID=1082933 RepID=G6Y581_9HYPH|nr:right-handed parallel beta-helix repeat-containing protein [Mesorhizobium amorphae]ANT51229.1 hypothetical protein A6B35_15560 [Mesorhizobium amorphae CCNWGS0123]EHH13132.1 hypothetical protein MEA186_05451 [Mesorhizobium amorphae CCNWGS0123]GLR45021.1 hypothetical protein GCM10007880_55380 [Mesorhizobium amorphae]